MDDHKLMLFASELFIAAKALEYAENLTDDRRDLQCLDHARAEVDSTLRRYGFDGPPTRRDWWPPTR